MTLRSAAVLALVLAPAFACSNSEAKTPAAKTTAPSGAKIAPASVLTAELGKTAPAIALTDIAGKERSLAEFAGKTVVLEWNNFECPFVKKHYGSGNMQALQKELTAKGVVWVTINSGAPGKQGHLDGAQAKAAIADRGASPTAYLLDPEGKIGRAYGAKTTPHMYVIDPKGTLVYAGGIDDKATANADDIKGAKNYVREAVEEVLAGKPVTTASTQPYGCGVKYQ
jgi:peroxiredoxin